FTSVSRVDMISRAALTELAYQRLETVSLATSYRGEVPQTPALIPDGSQRVQPYMVFYASPGRPGSEETLEWTTPGLAFQFQVTCVSGHAPDVISLVDRVSAVYEGWLPQLSGASGGRCRQLNDPGPVRRSDSPVPPRFWLPLIY